MLQACAHQFECLVQAAVIGDGAMMRSMIAGILPADFDFLNAYSGFLAIWRFALGIRRGYCRGDKGVISCARQSPTP